MHYHAEVYLKKLNGKPLMDAVGAHMNRGVKSKVGWDWFVIGGRWSGEKLLAKLDKDRLKAFWVEFKKRGYGWPSAEHSDEERRRDSQALFMEFFPDFKGEIPVWRDQYKREGGEGDVAKVEDLPETLSCHTLILPGKRRAEVLQIEEWNGKDFVKTAFKGDVVAELKRRGLTDGYLVTVDYHS